MSEGQEEADGGGWGGVRMGEWERRSQSAVRRSPVAFRLPPSV